MESIKTGKKFWTALALFGLIGQVAWVVENMYFNVFIYKMFHATAAQISLMVSASAVMATVTTIFMGALTDRVGKRKVFLCGGYLVWGIAILAFALVRMDVLTPIAGGVTEAAALGVNLVILLDCVMTFFGSTANDAAYNAWLTDRGTASNRGKIEGINAMMPLVAILVVFGGFMGFDLEQADSWSIIFLIIGAVVLVVGILGIFLIEETPVPKSDSYLEDLLYSFRPSTVKKNGMLYAVVGAFAIFGISIQIFMPYLILYYEKSLGMSNYVIVLAPAIILAAIVTAVYGSLHDQLGFQKSIFPCIAMLVGGYAILYFTVGTLPVFIGSLLMMSGYLSGMAVFGAVIRERIPEHMSGRFQGLRIIGQVLVPGVIGPVIGAWVLRDAVQIENQDGTFSFLPDRGIWAAAAVVAAVLVLVILGIFRMMRKGHYTLLTEAAQRRGWQEGACRENACQESLAEGWNIHPRPQLRRDGFMILKEGWKLNGQPIRVPFPPQSVFSGYRGKVGKQLTYECSFTIPENFVKERILLHFGAVDQLAEVYVNGCLVGRNEGGYLNFTFDITDFLGMCEENTASKKPHVLEVRVTDPLSRDYPYGKQRKKRGGMWYTPVSGIWQNVWLENVPERYVESIAVTPDQEGVELEVKFCSGAGEDVSRERAAAEEENVQPESFCVEICLSNGEILRQSFSQNTGKIRLAGYPCQDGSAYAPRLWSCEDPYLYNMKIITDSEEIETYFALRTIEIREVEGVQRVCLNGSPIFLHGVLDQGYFPEGIYLPAEPTEYERDVLRMKELGFNLLRKHIKVEPEAFYYYCDLNGMLVMQDMVNSGKYCFLKDTALPTIGKKKRSDKTGMSGKRKEFFVTHTRDTIRQLYNHPCIVAYTIFNEGWGQFESDKLYEQVKEFDSTRLIDSTSGWFWQEKSDFDSEHIYFKVIDLKVGQRPLLVSECGGYTRVVLGHFYSKHSTYGYGGAEDEEGLTEMITAMYRQMILPGIPRGVCGCVYTQLSDVEDEVNGLYTYDRRVCKVEKNALRELAREMKL